MRYDKGFTLIEVLIALFISAIIFTLLFEMVSKYRYFVAYHQEMINLQDSARFMAYWLPRDIEQSGQIGCAYLSNNFPIENVGVASFNQFAFNHDIQVYEKASDMDNTELSSRINSEPDSDIIEIHRMDPIVGRLLHMISNSELEVSISPEFQKDTDVIISDCFHATLVHVIGQKKEEKQSLYLKGAIQKYFDAQAEVGAIKTSLFFIQKKSNALYELNEHDRKNKLISGISKLHVYCLECDGNRNCVEKRPNQVRLWSGVLAIKLSVLLRSDLNVFLAPSVYKFDGKTYQNKDHHLYKSFVMTIPLLEHQIN